MSMAICPRKNLRCKKTPMFAGATSNFHIKEWFSSISIKMEGDNELGRTSYRQLRLLFKCNMQEDGDRNVSKELCLVQMYEEVGIDRRVQCPVLKWCGENLQAYVVINIRRILKAIHIIPDFEDNNRFFINLYKF